MLLILLVILHRCEIKANGFIRRIRFFAVYDIQTHFLPHNTPNISKIVSGISLLQNPNKRFSHPIISDKGTFFYKNKEIFGSFIERSHIISPDNILLPQIFLTFVHRKHPSKTEK